MLDLYSGSSTITGKLRSRKTLSFKTLLTRQERTILVLFFILITLTSSSLIWFILNMFASTSFNIIVVLAVVFIIAAELIRFIQSLTLVLFSLYAKDPVPMRPGSGLRIAVLTTIVPGKEPFELVARTLKAMKNINPGTGNTIDVWLLDEGNEPAIKSRLEEMGVHHFSRKDILEWNMPSGAFKAKTKHGNHNAWRSAYENNYDIIAQMDPDHVPRKDFVLRTLGYFKDPDVAFVVAPQVYGNSHKSWIAKASAFQAYLFHGIIQRGGNGLQAPLLIGTNHLYRVKAFKQINGYQDSIIEDHLTSMAIYSSKSETGNRWKGVYTPDILAVGEGPSSFTDYFNQQKRWAYGIWDIATKSTPHAIKKMKKSQALTFLMLQFFYPSVALTWVISTITTVLFSSLTAQYQNIGPLLIGLWLYSCASTIALFFWLRRFNLVEHEKKDWGLHGMALLLMCIPVYVSAGWLALTKRPLTYAVTAKGELASPDTLGTFAPHFYWIFLNIVGLTLMLSFSPTFAVSSIFWTIEHLVICILPIGIFTVAHYRSILPRIRTIKKYIDYARISRAPAVLSTDTRGER